MLEQFFEFAAAAGTWAAEQGAEELKPVLEIPWPRRTAAMADGGRTRQDWLHLCELLQDKQAQGCAFPEELALWLYESAGNGSLEGSADALRKASEEPAVRVMTIHKSKGLEFPLVYVLGGLKGAPRRPSGSDMSQQYRFLKDGRLTVDPFHREQYWNAHLAYNWEESKRLWYVAFTRASGALRVVWPVDGPLLEVDSI